MARQKVTLTGEHVQGDELHRRKTERTTRSNRGTIRLRHEKAVDLAYKTHAQRRVSRTHLAQESIRAHSARVETNRGATLQRMEYQREQQNALASQRAGQERQAYYGKQVRAAVVQPAIQPVQNASGSVVSGVVRAAVIIVGLSMLFLLVSTAQSNPGAVSGVFGGITSALGKFTQTTPLFKT